MTSGTEEFFKAIYIAAIFACACGLLKLALLERLDTRIRLVVGSFLALMLLPTTYLYLSLAFPSSAANLLPAQSMAIWMYGPLMMGVLHLVTNRPVHGWHIAAYVLPVLCSVTVRLTYSFSPRQLPPWWELLSFAQASVFAMVAISWTIRSRVQLRIAVDGFSGSSFGPLLYLSAGLFALLLTDLFVHWRLYTELPLSPLTFYLVVTPCALYALIISMVLIWRKTNDTPLHEERTMSVPAPQIRLHEVPKAAAQPRTLELSPAAARELEMHLDVLMREQGLYKRNDLTLMDLAAALRISTHLASELLNAHLKRSFYEFLNRYRTEEAARLLRAGNGKGSVTDIAYQAGFNNPNTFYREFKREYRVTPSQFRRADAASMAQSSAAHSSNSQPRV